jgi:CspA family cold shock protein
VGKLGLNVATKTGRILRFDDIRGYGFIAPDGGGDDVFMHANDLLDEKHLFRAGMRVEFEVEDGDKGLKACDISILDRDSAPGVSAVGELRPSQRPAATPTAVTASDADVEPSSPATLPRPVETSGAEDDEMCDVLSVAEFQNELTEAILTAEPTLTGAQITRVRRRVLEIATGHGWVQP